MQILLSSIGSRGDVQPSVALGLELQALGHRARFCAPPNFKEWVKSYGMECIAIGPDLKKMTGGTVTGKPVLPSKEQLQQLADQSVRTQFQVIKEAVRGCDLVIAAGALQLALRSVAEAQNIPYIFSTICPAVLPSMKYPPPKMGGHYPHTLPEAENLQLWRDDAASFNARFGAALNEERTKIGLDPIPSVRDYMFIDRPWLAADSLLAPAFPLLGMEVVQTGAWMISEPTPLADEIEKFLADGPPPIYFGFGSMRESDQTSRVLIEAARVLGMRSILLQGWANLAPVDAGSDCISVSDVNHEALLSRVAAVVHHGGAGTTHAAARAGKPQVIIPHNYDQFYWAYQMQQLGVGIYGPQRDELTVERLVQALRDCLQPEVSKRAQKVANRMELHGARIAAERLTKEFGS